MAYFRSIRSRSKRKSISKGHIELPLTSLLDILVIILVFLLKSYSTSQSTFVAGEGEMPYSASQNVPQKSHHVVITRDYIAFEDEKVLYFLADGSSPVDPDEDFKVGFRKEDLDEGGRRILPLFDVLTQAREKSELLRTKSAARTEEGEPLPFSGIIAIQADKRVSYEVLRKVMYTSATAGYRVYRLLAVRREH